MSRPVIDRMDFPLSPPFSFCVCVYLLLDKFNTPDMLRGAAYIILAIIFIALFLARIGQSNDIQTITDIIDERINERERLRGLKEGR